MACHLTPIDGNKAMTAIIDKITTSARIIPIQHNSQKLLDDHNKIIGGKLRFRFPPEPNGHLHIGHAKSMKLNFGLAQSENGVCYLRYDDTNPNSEKDEYIKSILDDVTWLGWKPIKITHTSDYFQQLYDFAVRLIKDNKAYVDYSSPDEIKKARNEKLNSPYRNNTIEHNLQVFDDMKNGKFANEKDVVLRLKIDMQNDNPNLRDPVIYRLKYIPHPITGKTWNIYPTYDFAHCIVDSLEHISYSLCTLEFENRRESYYWLLDALDLYRPYVWEFSRLNILENVLSKRRLLDLVENKYVNGWDDPRLLTIKGLRCRGYTPSSINTFIEKIGFSRNENTINLRVLENCIRDELNQEVPRAFSILDPLKVIITNWDGDITRTFTRPVNPLKPDMGTRDVFMTNVVYIDRSNFRVQANKKYYGLTPDKWVGLRYGPHIFCQNYKIDSDGKVTEVEVIVDWEQKEKVKKYAAWVSFLDEPAFITAYLYDSLFINNECTQINLKSKIEIRCMVEPHLQKAKKEERFQFEQVGYFIVNNEKPLIFNQIVSLKQNIW